jgi:hypothetical protein
LAQNILPLRNFVVNDKGRSHQQTLSSLVANRHPNGPDPDDIINDVETAAQIVLAVLGS